VDVGVKVAVGVGVLVGVGEGWRPHFTQPKGQNKSVITTIKTVKPMMRRAQSRSAPR
jgi:hypothetical protein